MRRLLFTALMMVCSVSWAKWEFAAATESYDAIYVDKSTRRKSGNFFKMWDLINFSEEDVYPDGTAFSSSKTFRRYDCVNKTSGVISVVSYSEADGGGKAVASGTLAKNEIKDEPISPESIASTLWKIACRKK
jgi:hypothetical protein